MSADTHSPSSSTTEAERRVVGGILQDNAQLWRLGDLAGEDFVDERLGELFETIKAKIREGDIVDPITLADDSGHRWLYAELGELHREAYAPANTPRYATIVLAHSRRRRQRQALQDALARLDRGEDGWWEGCVTAVQRAQHRRRQLLSHDDLLGATRQAREERERLRAEGRAYGIQTGLPSLDGTIGGVYGGRLWILGGRTGCYKSALAWQVALKNAQRGTPVGVISLEMDSEELGDRSERMFRDREEGPPAGLPVHVDQDVRTLEEVTWSAIEMHERYGAQLIVVDYLQLVELRSSHARYEQVSAISRSLKALAMRLGVPVLALSQLARGVDQENRMPRLSDLRESGAIEQDADIVTLLWRKEDRKGQKPDEFYLLLEKNRRGFARMKPLPLRVDGARMRVQEMVR